MSFQILFVYDFFLYITKYQYTFQYAIKGITAQTVLLFVLLIVRYVGTRTDCVLVRRDGWGITVVKVDSFSNTCI